VTRLHAPLRPVRRLGAIALGVAILAGCSSSSEPADDGASLGQTLPTTEVTVPEVPAPSPPRTGVVVVGASVSSFAVTACELEPGAVVDGTTTLLLVTGEGTTAGGIPFKVEVRRSSVATAVETFTDSVTYTDTARILQLQRLEVNGEVSDLRDPRATGTLLRTRPTGVAAVGRAGPPGSVVGEDEGIVGLAIDASCA